MSLGEWIFLIVLVTVFVWLGGVGLYYRLFWRQPIRKLPSLEDYVASVAASCPLYCYCRGKGKPFCKCDCEHCRKPAEQTKP